MRAYLFPLIQLQRFFLPGLICLTMWAVWRTVIKKDAAVGLGLYLGLAIIVDAYLNTGIYLPGLSNGSIRYSEVCALILLFNRPSTSNEPGQAPHASSMPMLWPVWVYFGLMFVAALRADDLVKGIMGFRGLIVPQIVAVVLATRGLKTVDDYRRFLLMFAGIALFVGIWDFWDVFFDRIILKSEVLYKAIYYHNRERNRFGSIFLNPNYLGAFVVLAVPPVFAWALSDRKRWPRAIAWGTLAFLMFSLVETQSRAALLAQGVCVLLLAIGPCGDVSRKRRIGTLLAFVAAFAIVMPGFIVRASSRFNEPRIEDEKGRDRETTWRYTLRIIGDSPALGIGFGEAQFQQAMKDYGFEYQFGVESLDAPHNSYLQAAVYAGVPALLAFLYANGILLVRAVGVLSRRVTNDKAFVVLGLAVGIVGFLVSIFPDLQLFTPNVAQVYWVFYGLLVSLITTAQLDQPAAGIVPAGFGRRTASPVLAVSTADAQPRPIAVVPRRPERAPRRAAANRTDREEPVVIFNIVRAHDGVEDDDPRPSAGTSR